MPISTPLKNVKVGPYPPKRSLLDIPNTVLTLVSHLGSPELLLRYHVGNVVYDSGGRSKQWFGILDYTLPDSLPAGVTAPGNVLAAAPPTLDSIPDLRVFVTCSIRNSHCRNSWFKYKGDFYSYNGMRVGSPAEVDALLGQGVDYWTKMEPQVTPGTVFFVTDWEVEVAA